MKKNVNKKIKKNEKNLTKNDKNLTKKYSKKSYE